MQGVKRVLRVLEAVSAADGPVGVGELARSVDLPKSTLQRHLWALAEAGWIRSVGTEQTKWTLTSRALLIGQRGSREGALREVALEPMRALRDLVDETVTLQVPVPGFNMVQIERVDTAQAVRTYSTLGSTWPCFATAGGLAYLATLSEQDLDEALRNPLPRLTPDTITDPVAIRVLLATARERGFAVNIGQNRVGVCAVGCVLRDVSGEPIAALGISLPDSRFDEAAVPDLGARLLDAARIIEQRL